MKYLVKFLWRVTVFVGVTCWYSMIFIVWILHMFWELRWIKFKIGAYWYMDFAHETEVESGFARIEVPAPGLITYSVVHRWKTGYHYVFGFPPKIIDTRDNHK